MPNNAKNVGKEGKKYLRLEKKKTKKKIKNISVLK